MKYAYIENGKITAIRSDSHRDFRLNAPWLDITGRQAPIEPGWTYDSANDSFTPPPEEPEDPRTGDPGPQSPVDAPQRQSRHSPTNKPFLALTGRLAPMARPAKPLYGVDIKEP